MHAYCINLERRPDRRQDAQDEFEKFGIDVEFWKATDGKLGAPDGLGITDTEWGCADSHIRIWRNIVEQNYEMGLVFEDDVKILHNFNEKLDQVLREAPANWDFINLGALDARVGNEYVSPLLRDGAAYGTHCYLISNRGARKMALWDAKDLNYGIDLQIARSPYKLYYTKDALANQVSAGSSTLGGIMSWVQGDIGFSRTLDWDFILREQLQKVNWFLVLASTALIYVVISPVKR